MTAYASTVYAGGGGEDENRSLYIVGNNVSGLDRFEIFADCGNAEDSAELIRQAEARAAEAKRLQGAEADVSPYRTFQYGRDYQLGDRVTIRPMEGVEMHARITAVKEVWEPAGYTCEPIFGDAPVTMRRIVRSLSRDAVKN